MKVLWTDAAVAQLQAIHNYLAQTSPDYAIRIIDRLTRRSIQIAAFPNSGRMVPEYEKNESSGSYRGSVSKLSICLGQTKFKYLL